MRILGDPADNGRHDDQVIEDRLIPHHAVAVDVAAVCPVHAVDDARQLGGVDREQERVLGRPVGAQRRR